MAARDDFGSSVGDNGRGVIDDLTCPVPWCQDRVCSEAARFVIAACDEVPAGCANRSRLSEVPDRLRQVVGSGEIHMTPGARSLVALRPGGGDPRNVLIQLAEGRLVFLEPRTPRPLRSASVARRTPQTPPIAWTPPAARDDKVSWIKIRVVDDQSGGPLPGVVLKITHPNRKTFDYTTRPDGVVEVNGIDPGTCDVTCGLEDARIVDTYDFVTVGDQPSPAQAPEKAAETPDAGDGKGKGQSAPGGRIVSTKSSGVLKQGVRIARVEEHKVHTGESIKSLAEANGLTWQELARFNWNTDVPDEINIKLRDEVGCTRKTPDGFNYHFDDRDDPGVIFIPRAWQQAGLATEQEHVVRVRSLGYTAGHWVEVRVVDDAGKPIEGLDVTLIRGDGSRKPAKTDAKGMARWGHLADEKVRVTIDDKEYALEPESEVDDAAPPEAVAVASDGPGGASGGPRDLNDMDPTHERRQPLEEE